MGWKEGKYGVHSGRTLRSHFGSGREVREGLLVQSASASVNHEGMQDYPNESGDAVFYSLGKRKRWLIPGLVKDGALEEDSEVVLVERYHSESSRGRLRGDCFSVYDSTTGCPRKARGKLAHATDLLEKSRGAKLFYEVCQPVPEGMWPKHAQTKKGLRKRKGRTSSKKRKNIDVGFDELPEEDYEDEIYDQDETSSSELSVRTNFELSIFLNVSHVENSVYKAERSKPLAPKETLCKEHCVYVDSDDDMQETHKKFLAEIEAEKTTIKEAELHNATLNRTPRRRRTKARDEQQNPLTAAAEKVPEVPSICKPEDNLSGEVLMNFQEVQPNQLLQQWGGMYQEGACLPRKFTLDLAPLMSGCHGDRGAYLVCQVGCQQERNPSRVKSELSLAIWNNLLDHSEIYIKAQMDFVSKLATMKDGDVPVWSVQEAVHCAVSSLRENLSCMESQQIQDYGEPPSRKSRHPLKMLEDLFGWKSKTFSVKRARQEVRESITKSVHVRSDATEEVAMATEELTVCGICFVELQGMCFILI